MNEKQKRIEEIYGLARLKGLCKTKKEFAELVGLNASSISSALNGREGYLSDKMLRTIETWAKYNGVLDDGPALKSQEPARPDIVIPAATMDLYTSMAKSIDRLTALVERLQPGASAYTSLGSQAPKNYRIEK